MCSYVTYTVSTRTCEYYLFVTILCTSAAVLVRLGAPRADGGPGGVGCGHRRRQAAIPIAASATTVCAHRFARAAIYTRWKRDPRRRDGDIDREKDVEKVRRESEANPADNVRRTRNNLQLLLKNCSSKNANGSRCYHDSRTRARVSD